MTTKLEDPRVRIWLWVVACVAGAALVLGMIVGVAAIYDLAEATRSTQLTNTERAKVDRERDEVTAQTAADAARSAERIEDCTTPGRPCFERNSRATSDAVAGINQGTLAVITAALSCQADGIIDQGPLARCTAQRARASSVSSDSKPPNP